MYFDLFLKRGRKRKYQAGETKHVYMSLWASVVNRIMVPQRCSLLIPRTVNILCYIAEEN